MACTVIGRFVCPMSIQEYEYKTGATNHHIPLLDCTPNVDGIGEELPRNVNVDNPEINQVQALDVGRIVEDGKLGVSSATFGSYSDSDHTPWENVSHVPQLGDLSNTHIMYL